MLLRTCIQITRLVVFILLLTGQAAAWTAGLKEAADAFALGKSTPLQEMLIFFNNSEVNLLAQEGKISMSTYRSCQEEFFNLNESFANRAVHDAGFNPNISNRKFNPGTDTDVNVLGTSGKKVTLNDINKIESNYEKIVRDHFRNRGLNPPQGPIHTETDFMPHPQHTDPDEFRKIVNYVNQSGGTAYQDPLAAAAQSKLGTTQSMSTGEVSAFSSTMKDFADMKITRADALRTEARSIRSSNPGRAEFLEAQARQFDYQAAKYHNRIDAANNHLRRQYGLPENPRDITGFQQSADIIEIGGRNPFTGKDAANIHSMHRTALQRSTDEMIDTLVEIARQNPSKAAEIQKALGREIHRLPPNRAGQAIERIENATKGVKGLDKSLATGAVTEARMLQHAGKASTKWATFKQEIKNVTGINRMTKLSAVMTVGSAVLMGYQGVSITLNDVKATDTLWDYFRNCYYHAAWEGTGIGPAFEQAQQEEIEHYMKAFEAGQSPSMAKHLTFTMLKTGTYLGRDAIIGLLYLPDTIWEYFTQEKEMEGYAAMQNELAQVMRQMIKDQKEFNAIMADMKNMGLHDSDTKAFLDCLCSRCGGSLGGFFNPACKSDIGHGPCQCNGPLSIWKTPLRADDKQTQYDCFNRVTKMRHDEAQAIFDKWRRKMTEENAKSVQPELDQIKQEINNHKNLEENEARKLADRFSAIKELLLPAEADTIRASLGPSLENHASENVRQGDLDRALDNLDRALNKVGPRNSDQRNNINQNKSRYEKWAEQWSKTKAKQFPEIYGLIHNKRTQQAGRQIDFLEQRMGTGLHSSLPPAFNDPALLSLKERLAEQMKRYEEAMQDMWKKVEPLGPEREHRRAVPILQKAREEWEHPPQALERLDQRLAYHQRQIRLAEDRQHSGRESEKKGGLASAVQNYEESVQIQKDSTLEPHLAKLKTELEKQQKARKIWDQANQLQLKEKHADALQKYKEGLAVWYDPAIKDKIATLEKFIAQRKQQEATKSGAYNTRVAGTYSTTWNNMTLTQNGARVTGTYNHNGGRIEGVLSDNTLTGSWTQTNSKGKFRFEFEPDGSSFSGKWGYNDNEPSSNWSGKRIAGLETSAMPSPATPKESTPANANLTGLVGEWSVVGNNYQGKIEFSLAGATLNGRIWMNHNGFWQTLEEIHFDGRTLTFLRPIKGADQHYTGLLNGNQIEGTFTQKNTTRIYQWKMWREQGLTPTSSAQPSSPAPPKESAQEATKSGAYNTRVAGTYSTTWNNMTLTQNGARVTGTYNHNGGRIEGVLRDNTLTGSWTQTNSKGKFRFEFEPDGSSFSGKWGYNDNEPSSDWSGKRIAGLETSAMLSPATVSSVGQSGHTPPPSQEKSSLALERNRFTPGEAIQVHFTAPGDWPKDAWIGIVPSHIPHGDERQNDNHDIAYQYLNQRTSGTLTFTAPAVGNWDFRLHDTDNNGKEYASVSFRVEATPAQPLTKVEPIKTTDKTSTSETISEIAKTSQPAATIPSGWKSITIGNVGFAVPGSWQHKTIDDSDLEQMYAYWDGSFDTPLHGVSGGIAKNYDQAKREFPSPRTVRLGGAEVLRADEGQAINLLFPPIPGNRGVALVIFRDSGGNPATIDTVLQTFRVNGQIDAGTNTVINSDPATGQAWVLVDRKIVRGKTPEPYEGGEVRVDIGTDTIEMLLSRPYKDNKYSQRLHARYSWTMPASISPGGQLVVPVTQRVLSDKTGKWANSLAIGVSIQDRWDLTGTTGGGQEVKSYMLGIGHGKPDWIQKDLTVTYKRDWLWTTDQPGGTKTVFVKVHGVGSHKFEYRYQWK